MVFERQCPDHKIFCTVVYGITFNSTFGIYSTADIKQVAQDLSDEWKCQYTWKNKDVLPQKSLEPHLYSLEIITKSNSGKRL